VPIRRLPNGTIEFDTVEEMIAYDQALQTVQPATGENKPVVRRTPVNSNPVRTPVTSTSDAWNTFCSGLAGRDDHRATRMKTVLTIVKKSGANGASWEDLMDALGDGEITKTSGTVSGMAKSARSSGLNPKDIVVVGEDKRVRPGPLLQRNVPPPPFPTEEKA
jgi:hypothetical protein